MKETPAVSISFDHRLKSFKWKGERINKAKGREGKGRERKGMEGNPITAKRP